MSRLPTIGARCLAAGSLPSFSASLTDGLRAAGADVEAVADEVQGSACAEQLNQRDVAVLHHDIRTEGDVLDLIDGLQVPSIVVMHTVPQNPTAQQRSVMEEIAAKAGHVVVLSDSARRMLSSAYAVDSSKVTVIPHGTTIPRGAPPKRSGRPVVLTWGLLAPGKGVERVIDAMPSLSDVPGRPKYVFAGPTHPDVLAAEGEAYRESLLERARSKGVADSVHLDPANRGIESRTVLVRSAAVIVLPYDSTDQATSGVLVDAIAGGRPIIATAFPHAVELLTTGAGVVVDHDDPAAMALALRRVLTLPRLAGDMAGAARQLAPSMAWPVVADAYLRLARRLLSGRAVLV